MIHKIVGMFNESFLFPISSYCTRSCDCFAEVSVDWRASGGFNALQLTGRWNVKSLKK